jgi:hypothetical protein
MASDPHDSHIAIGARKGSRAHSLAIRASTRQSVDVLDRSGVPRPGDVLMSISRAADES